MNEANAQTNERGYKKIDDSTVAAEVRDLSNGGQGSLTLPEIADLLDELLRYRRASRGDSRRAEQHRRMRWQLENLTEKVEELHERIAAQAPAIETETVDHVIERERAQESACRD